MGSDHIASSRRRGFVLLVVAFSSGCDGASPASSPSPEKNASVEASRREAESSEPEVEPQPEAKPEQPAKKKAPPTAPAPREGPEPQPVEFAKTQPCTITTKSRDPEANLECFEVRALQVAGHPQRICSPIDEPYTFTYDDRGRVLDDGRYSYEYRRGGKAVMTWIGGGKPTVFQAEFDAAGRMVRAGKARHQFDEGGRLVRSEYGRRFTATKYAADGTYLTSNNYPDSDEECESDLFVVRRNRHGQNVREEYGGCEINESARTLTFEYDSAGRAVHIDVDLQTGEDDGDGSVDFTIDVSYACHDAVPG